MISLMPFVQQQRLNRAQKWKDQFKAHSENLAAMEALSATGLPRVKNMGALCGRFLLSRVIVILIFRGRFFGPIVSHTEWHRCVVFGKLSEFAKTLTKGAHVQLEGELRSRGV